MSSWCAPPIWCQLLDAGNTRELTRLQQRLLRVDVAELGFLPFAGAPAASYSSICSPIVMSTAPPSSRRISCAE
ncbi:MAG: hypothetical protein ABJC89_15375 [Acidobacteriota bacterium]